MPRNFLEGCEAIEALRDDLPDLTTDTLDQLITQANIMPDSPLDDLKFLQDRTGIDSLAAIEAAEAAEECRVCGDLSRCAIGSFLSNSV